MQQIALKGVKDGYCGGFSCFWGMIYAKILPTKTLSLYPFMVCGFDGFEILVLRIVNMRKLAFVVLAVFGLVNVSFGAWISDKNEEMYQKLKAEMEEVEQGLNERRQITCSWGEDGKVIIGDIGHNGMYAENWCELKNVLAFVDEYRANKGKGGIYTYYEIEKMPRFKEDSGIYGWKSIGTLLEKALEKWKKVKLEITIQTNW